VTADSSKPNIILCQKKQGRRRAGKWQGHFSSALSKGDGGAFFITVLRVISWFIKIELKQIYCSYLRNKKIQHGCLSFLLLFLRSTLFLNRNKNISNDLLVFCNFPFPSTFLLLSLLYRCFGVPEKKHESKRSIAANTEHFFNQGSL